MSQPLLRFVTWFVVGLIGNLRQRHERYIASVIRNPATRTPEKMKRMIVELLRGEARLWREITEGAMRELGIAYTRKPMAAYARPTPRCWAELRNRFLAYRNMLGDPEACVRRLVAALKAGMDRSPLDRARGLAQPTLLDVAPILMQSIAPRAVAHAHPAIHPP